MCFIKTQKLVFKTCRNAVVIILDLLKLLYLLILLLIRLVTIKVYQFERKITFVAGNFHRKFLIAVKHTLVKSKILRVSRFKFKSTVLFYYCIYDPLTGPISAIHSIPSSICH